MDKPETYHAGARELQDARDTRRIADRLAEVTLRSQFTDEDRAFIERSRMLFVATADADGWPECSYKGGVPGFVRVVGGSTLEIPDYDGNGMYRSWGNVRVNPRVALLFLDFETPKRLRVNGRAEVLEEPALCAAHPGAVFVVRVHAEPQLPALYPSNAAGGRIRLRAAPRPRAARACLEDVRRVSRRFARARQGVTGARP